MLILEQAFAMILVFGIVVFIHELGHFLAAKRAGVYAPRFSIGFGPALWKRKWGETEYVIAAIPLGGYVRMASREDDSMAAIEGGGETGLDIPPDRYFEAKSLPTRVGILVAGVTMNVLLGFCILTGVYYVRGVMSPATNLVRAVQPVDAAPTLGTALQPGDSILAVDGRRVRSWGDFFDALTKSHAPTLRITTQRGTTDVALAGNPDSARRQVWRAVDYEPGTTIGDVIPDGPADRGGVQRGDIVRQVAGQPVKTWEDFTKPIKASANKPVPIVVQRDGELKSLTITPMAGEDPSDTSAKPRTVGQIMVYQASAREPVSFREAVVGGWRNTWEMAGIVVVTLKRLIVGQLSVKALSGPVGIARQSAAAVRQGWDWVLWLIAMLSINVAVLNMLPIPVLDGGQILMNVIESAKGSALKLQTREYLLRFGVAALALLFLVVMYNDVVPPLVDWLRHRFHS